MQHKKIDFTKKLKLSSLTIDENKHKTHTSEKDISLINRSNNAKTVSFRLRRVDLDRLHSSLENANNINESHSFNKTDLIRGLILLGTEIDPKKILSYIRNSL